MSVRVKICGITRLEDAVEAVELGADALGFNFYERSRRYIEPRETCRITERLPNNIEKVGVFVNMRADEIKDYVQLTALTSVQLHGDETPEFLNYLRTLTNVKIIKAIRTGPGFDPACIRHFRADAILLDGYSVGAYGGTGMMSDWVAALATKEFAPDLYLAGGLHADNVREAVGIVSPQWVDVASGVESSPGIKDRNKMAAFIRAAKEA